MKIGLSLIVFPILIAIGVVRYIHTSPSKRTELSKKYFLRFVVGVLSVFFGVLLVDIFEPLISFLLILFGFYLALFSGMDLTSQNPQINEVQAITNNDLPPLEKSPATKVFFNVDEKKKSNHNLNEAKNYYGNIRCRHCGYVGEGSIFAESALGSGYKKCISCNKDFKFLSTYISEKTYLGNYRCNSCGQQDEEKFFLPSDAGGNFRQCHMCGSHFQIE